jgi:addiction module HigA family antidote
MAKSGAGKSAGEELKKKIVEFGVSKKAVSDVIGQNAAGLKLILDGKKNISTNHAFILGKYFGTGENVWLDLQKKYSLEESKSDARFQKKLKDLKKAEKVKAGAKKAPAKKTTKGKMALRKAAVKK